MVAYRQPYKELIMSENEKFNEKDFSNGELVFHYDRKKRLQEAPKQVQDFYNGTGPKAPRGFFKCLVSTKANRIILFVMISVLVIFIGIYLFGKKSNEGSLGDTNFELKAFSYEDRIFVSLKMSRESENNINITISPIDKDNQILDSRNFSKIEADNLVFRTTFENHDIIKITAKITDITNNTEINLNCKIEER
ncbi:MAG: hypothetical protein ACTTHG_06185 [Treponemataceae bacterium]